MGEEEGKPLQNGWIEGRGMKGLYEEDWIFIPWGKVKIGMGELGLGYVILFGGGKERGRDWIYKKIIIEIRLY